jgi:hypothetical protein
MPTLRVSSTDLDAFRRFREDEGADLGLFLAQLRRRVPPTPAMIAGTALHAALEQCLPGSYGVLAARGHTFTFEAEGEIDLPEVREMKATRDYEIDGLTVTLVGKVDAMRGTRIDDHKLTGRFDPERYLASVQWRAYLEIFDADEFRWNVFEGRPVAERSWTITGIHALSARRYPGMADDLRRELAAFTAFARMHLPERVGEPKAPPRQASFAGLSDRPGGPVRFGTQTAPVSASR